MDDPIFQWTNLVLICTAQFGRTEYESVLQPILSDQSGPPFWDLRGDQTRPGMSMGPDGISFCSIGGMICMMLNSRI